jgi:hypothetical protein
MASALQITGSGLARVVERLVVQAARDVQMLAALTPLDAHRERERLVAALRAGQAVVPRWRYAPAAHDVLRRALDAAESALAGHAESAIDRLYLDRVRELSLEASLCAAAGTAEVASLANERFAPYDEATRRAASALCARWLAEHGAAAGSCPETIASDDRDARSLLSCLRAAVGRLRLPFSVVVHSALAPLAATGDGVILVAAGRPLTEEDARRTVLHEIEGHARPRARAMQASLALFRAGTARGIDHQEGRALLLEERAGMLGARRRLQLAARHRAVEAMLGGATFGDVAALLVRDHGHDALQAVVVAERVFRGSDGTRPGLGRERVYLEAFVRVRAHLEVHPDDEALLAAGQVATDAAEALRAERGPC